MKVNTNHWNKIRYTVYAPVYDFFVSSLFKKSRMMSIRDLNIKPGEKVLIVGAGTGLDLPYINKEANVVATDITPAMVRKVSALYRSLGYNLEVKVMDGQNLTFKEETFDKVICHLILAVIPDPVACLKECERVLKKGGEVAVFDKFIRSKNDVSLIRKVLNVFSNLFFSDITRDIRSIVAATNLQVVSDTPADFNGNFRMLKLKKN